MIYSFGAKNFLSFREGMNVSFELNSKVPKSISQGKKVGTVLGIKGANASGKTNILKCLSFISKFVLTSFEKEENAEIEIEPFFSSNKPTEFYIDFEHSGTRYIYELKLTNVKIYREALYKKISRRTLLFERIENEVARNVSELDEIKIVNLRSNASLISSLTRYKLSNPSSDIERVIKFFKQVLGNVHPTGVYKDTIFTVDRTSKFYHENPDAFLFAKDIILKCDLGISDIELHERTSSNNEKEYFPIFLHNVDGKCADRWLTSWEESTGTIALYTKLFLYWAAIKGGGILIMDEFDVHCHPQLLPHIINLFLDPETNTKNAQFIFTAHSSEIIDALGKYRVILVNKENGESYCYRLDEIPGDLIRNDRPIAPIYREGKLGGVPHYG